MQTNQTDSQQAVERYIGSGFAPIPVPAGQKNPNRAGWQHERHGAENIPALWNNGQNVGILCGEPSGGLADVDLDTKEARVAAAHILPPTRTSGRESCPDSHKWYYADPLPRTKAYKLPGKGEERSVVELRSTGAQTLVYPSRHPSGDRYVWADEAVEISRIDGARLSEDVADVATAALIARNWPGPGARHDYALAATGYIGRRTPRRRAERIMRAAVAASGDEEGADRTRGVADTFDKLAAGSPATGGPTLDQLAPGVVDQLCRWHSWSGSNEARPEGTDPVSATFALTDLGNAERLVHHFGDRIRYCEKWRAWIVSDGKVWKTGAEMAVTKMAHQIARGIHAEAADEPDKDRQRAIAKWALASQNDTRIRAMIAQARPYVGIEPEELDADPLLLNCTNGTVDLRTGDLREHRREDYITKMTGTRYDPEAVAPRFEMFLREVLVDEEVVSFVLRFAGYTLTGLTRERVFAMLHGRGKNGKSTLVELLIDVMGDYATTTGVETILAKRYHGVGNDVAALKGARLVATSEVERGRALAESKVKQLTGSDTVTARFLYGEPFSFRPEFKLWLSTNNRPDVHGTDDAIWDRIRLIPFTQRFEGSTADPELPDKLRGELPGILALMVRGCIEWQRIGLGEPPEVVAATDSYREDMDTLGAFIDERCILHPSAEVKATPLYDAYKEWCERSTEHAESQRRFGMRLTERGLENEKVGGVYRWYGIGLRHPAPGPSGGGFGPDHGDGSTKRHPNGPDASANRTNGPDAENRIGTRDSRGAPQLSGPSGPNIHNSPLDSTHGGDFSKKGPDGPDGPDGVENQGAGESWY